MADNEVVESRSARPRIKLTNLSNYFWVCDGPCTTGQGNYRELHFCRTCYDTCFCEDCLKLVKAGQVPLRRKCTPDHNWLRISCPDLQLHAGKTEIEGHNEGFEQLKARLLERWSNSVR